MNIEKISKECVGRIKAAKLAGKIAAKVAPILTYTCILEQTMEGYQKGGLSDAAIRGLVAIVESTITTAVFGILIAAEWEILPAATLTLLASTIISYLLKHTLNHFKL